MCQFWFVINYIQVLSELSYKYAYIAPDDGIKYGQQSLELATKLNWQKGIAGAYSDFGNNYQSKSDYPKALEYHFKALKIFEESGDINGLATITGNIGNVYVLQGDYPKALEYNFKALNLFKETGDKNGIARNAGTIATVYQRQNDVPKALEYFNKALNLFGETGNKQGLAMITGNIGNIYLGQSNYPKALDYYFKALKLDEEGGYKQYAAIVTANIGAIYAQLNDYSNGLAYFFKSLKIDEEIGDKEGIARSAGNIGLVYGMKKDNPKALEYYFKALKINEDIGNKYGIGSNANNIGIAYENQKNYAIAVDYYQISLKIATELSTKNMQASALANIGETYYKMVTDPAAKTTGVTAASEFSINKYLPPTSFPKGKDALLAGAIDYMKRSLVLTKEIQDLDQMYKIYENLTGAYKLKGDYKQAMEYGDSTKVIKDSIFSQENSQKITMLENKRKEYGDSLKAASEKIAADIKAAHRRNYELIGAAAFLLLLGFTFLLTRNNKLLDKEKKESEGLLLNILPEEVASQLKKTGAAEARQFDNVTVLFTDFVNFTEAGAHMSPQALIEELNTCFKKFDEITAAHNIEKIKTIGDAYLAVAGLPTPDPKHAENVVRAAKEISAFMQDRVAKLGNRTFEIRIGVHSGSVVAGIVGIKKFAYDIWGDTVNTAARMEQNSEPGRINISETTYELVKDKIDCEYRGEIEAKGKGMLKMYYVSAGALA